MFNDFLGRSGYKAAKEVQLRAQTSGLESTSVANALRHMGYWSGSPEKIGTSTFDNWFKAADCWALRISCMFTLVSWAMHVSSDADILFQSLLAAGGHELIITGGSSGLSVGGASSAPCDWKNLFSPSYFGFFVDFQAIFTRAVTLELVDYLLLCLQASFFLPFHKFSFPSSNI